MNKNKIFTLLLLSTVGFPAFAQGVIYKCTDSSGEVSYSTEAQSSKCEKTNLAKIDKGNIINKPSVLTNSSTNNSEVKVPGSEQIIRDQKRFVILQGELTQEKSLLKTILEMLSKAEKNDTAQLSQLKKMEDTHKRNIAALEKELGLKGDIQLSSTSTPKTNNIPSGLPFSLPKEAGEVQLVEVPQLDNQPRPYVQKEPANFAKFPVIPVNPPTQQAPIALIPTEPTPVKPEIIKEIRQPATITNKSIKNKILVQ